MFDKGLANRKAVLGAEHVERSLASADAFTQPIQELVTEYCWGAVWGRDDLPRKTRSIINLAMLTALGVDLGQGFLIGKPMLEPAVPRTMESLRLDATRHALTSRVRAANPRHRPRAGAAAKG